MEQRDFVFAILSILPMLFVAGPKFPVLVRYVYKLCSAYLNDCEVAETEYFAQRAKETTQFLASKANVARDDQPLIQTKAPKQADPAVKTNPKRQDPVKRCKCPKSGHVYMCFRQYGTVRRDKCKGCGMQCDILINYDTSVYEYCCKDCQNRKGYHHGNCELAVQKKCSKCDLLTTHRQCCATCPKHSLECVRFYGTESKGKCKSCDKECLLYHMNVSGKTYKTTHCCTSCPKGHLPACSLYKTRKEKKKANAAKKEKEKVEQAREGGANKNKKKNKKKKAQGKEPAPELVSVSEGSTFTMNPLIAPQSTWREVSEAKKGVKGDGNRPPPPPPPKLTTRPTTGGPESEREKNSGHKQNDEPKPPQAEQTADSPLGAAPVVPSKTGGGDEKQNSGTGPIKSSSESDPTSLTAQNSSIEGDLQENQKDKKKETLRTIKEIKSPKSDGLPEKPERRKTLGTHSTNQRVSGKPVVTSTAAVSKYQTMCIMIVALSMPSFGVDGVIETRLISSSHYACGEGFSSMVDDWGQDLFLLIGEDSWQINGTLDPLIFPISEPGYDLPTPKRVCYRVKPGLYLANLGEYSTPAVVELTNKALFLGPTSDAVTCRCLKKCLKKLVLGDSIVVTRELYGVLETKLRTVKFAFAVDIQYQDLFGVAVNWLPIRFGVQSKEHQKLDHIGRVLKRGSHHGVWFRTDSACYSASHVFSGDLSDYRICHKDDCRPVEKVERLVGDVALISPCTPGTIKEGGLTDSCTYASISVLGDVSVGQVSLQKRGTEVSFYCTGWESGMSGGPLLCGGKAVGVITGMSGIFYKSLQVFTLQGEVPEFDFVANL